MPRVTRLFVTLPVSICLYTPHTRQCRRHVRLQPPRRPPDHLAPQGGAICQGRIEPPGPQKCPQPAVGRVGGQGRRLVFYGGVLLSGWGWGWEGARDEGGEFGAGEGVGLGAQNIDGLIDWVIFVWL